MVTRNIHKMKYYFCTKINFSYYEVLEFICRCMINLFPDWQVIYIMSKKLYYLLSLTWGLPLNLLGGIVSLILLLKGYKPKKFGWCYYFEVGYGWGGLELGLVFICAKDSSDRVKAHEFGHSIQNCFFGFFMPFIICIPSVIRYWYRAWKISLGKTNLPEYDSIWFEGQATQLGLKYMGS